jgi:hypothetical protein
MTTAKQPTVNVIERSYTFGKKISRERTKEEDQPVRREITFWRLYRPKWGFWRKKKTQFRLQVPDFP